jgi:hypothetical protein
MPTYSMVKRPRSTTDSIRITERQGTMMMIERASFLVLLFAVTFGTSPAASAAVTTVSIHKGRAGGFDR